MGKNSIDPSGTSQHLDRVCCALESPKPLHRREPLEPTYERQIHSVFTVRGQVRRWADNLRIPRRTIPVLL